MQHSPRTPMTPRILRNSITMYGQQSFCILNRLLDIYLTRFYPLHQYLIYPDFRNQMLFHRIQL